MSRTVATLTPLADTLTLARALNYRLGDVGMADLLSELRSADTGTLRELLAINMLGRAQDEGRASLIIRLVGLWVETTARGMVSYEQYGTLLEAPRVCPRGCDVCA